MDTNQINIKNVLNTDDCFKILDLYFKKDNIMYRHHLDSYDIFIDRVKNLLIETPHMFHSKHTEFQHIKQYFKFTNVKFSSPTNSNGEYITPNMARINSISYDLSINVDVEQIQEIYDIRSNKKFSTKVGGKVFNFPFTKIPLMVKSKYCNLHINKELYKTECIYDNGGFFIINGTEKIFVPYEELIDNKPLAFQKKDSNGKYTYVQLNSKPQNPNEMRQIINIRMKSTDLITLVAPIFQEMSVFIVLRALGMQSDKDIIETIVNDPNDFEMISLLKRTLDSSRNVDNGVKIQTQSVALEYIIKKSKVEVNYSESNPELKKIQQIKHMELLLSTKFIPHMPKVLYSKALYLCYMINKLLLVYLGRKPHDERDSYENKRIEMPGTILYEMFKKQFKILITRECEKLIPKNSKDNNPINIIDKIKTTFIEGGIKRSMTKDEYNGRSGVCQIVQRGSYLNTISLQTRIDAQIKNKKSSSKLLQTRYGHGTQLGLICLVQTPENNKAGLVKHLTMLSRLTIETSEQIKILYDIVNKNIIKLNKVQISQFKNSVKIIFNGIWLGIIQRSKAEDFYNMLKKKKILGEIDIFTSITYNIRSEYENDEIVIWCDEGRIVTLMLKVENNKLLMDKQKIYELTKFVEGTNKTDTIENFMKLNPGVLEYVDANELFHSIVAERPMDVYNEKNKELKSLELTKKIFDQKINVNQVLNRYDEFSFIEYSYCFIHPSITMGSVVNQTPFIQCGQSPRAIYCYSQIKQALSLYSTKYKDRLDISYILYNFYEPMVRTRTAKYTHTDKLPYGENVIVAVMSYTGFNQDDSLIMNGGSIDTGMFSSATFSKYISKLEKNQTTSKNDIFGKPTPDKVIQYKHGSYEKLNEKGYVDEETLIKNEDVIIGKMTPLQEPVNGKIFKDSSTLFKSGEPGKIQKVHTKIVNNDGYEMIKINVRSYRIPAIGDKFASRLGQKGTVGAIYRQVDMPFTKDGVYPDIIMTPNAYPSRMTLSQQYELLFSKYGAINGTLMDGTSFEPLYTEEIKKKFKEQGLSTNGKEILVNGITGKTLNNPIFIGPTYYLRLKHIVSDKIHARARGPLTILTRQPPDGRARDGGLRFGEMERDCMIGHGASRFLKEKMIDVSDKFYLYICRTCGLIAQRRKTTTSGDFKDESHYSKPNDIYECLKCGNKAKINKTVMPYAFKLMIQEMYAMGIQSKIILN